MDSQTSTTVIERKTTLDGMVDDFVCDVLLLLPGEKAVLRYVVDREWVIGGGAISVPRGAVTISHYWVDRPYNVYHWLVGGRTLAYYCNVVTDTIIRDDLVSYRDLAIDVLIRPSGAADVLDEDEVPDDLAPAHRLVIARALEALVANPRFVIREIEAETAAALRRV